MQIAGLQVYAPAFFSRELSDAGILGAVVWLWSHSVNHREIPLYSLADTVMPFITRQQYALFSENNQPVAMISWAWFDALAEQRYLTQPYLHRPETDWLSGDRLWCMDWVAPFGHSKTIYRLLAGFLFSERCMRSQYHRGHQRGQRVLFMAGKNLSRREMLAWHHGHPLPLNWRQTWLIGGRK